jgi:formylmethanofuran dehydrogenase subunit E
MNNTHLHPKGMEERFDEKFLAKEDEYKVIKTGLSTFWASDIKVFIREELATAVLKEREERDRQILSWHKLPIKESPEGKIGPILCDCCGGTLYAVRGRHPNEPRRIICPTCSIEILESIYSNLYPNKQEASLLSTKEEIR